MTASEVDAQSEIKENTYHENGQIINNLNELQSKSSHSIKTLENVNFINNENCTKTFLCEEHEVKVKKKVNIYTEESSEATHLRKDSVASNSMADRSSASNGTENCLTMTGTVKRGKKAGQNLDFKINMSREELEMLDADIVAKSQQSWVTCGMSTGPHVTVWTLICFPFAVLAASIYSFYIGTLMWYNIFTYVTEETHYIWRILLSPILILFYPLFIILCTISLGLYAGMVQISWFFDTWLKEITDLEKGFYGWLCSKIHLEDCSPYEVIVLTDVQVPSHAASQDTLTG